MPSFNTQPPEGGCLATEWLKRREAVSTHSHPKVAAPPRHRPSLVNHVPTHSHPKVAANGHKKSCPPTAFQHTATRRWLPATAYWHRGRTVFQHTATRRWLLRRAYHGIRCAAVSTHSHPKVAAVQRLRGQLMALCFNTQPPEGGCFMLLVCLTAFFSFNTQPPEGGCSGIKYTLAHPQVSTHSHPKVAAAVCDNWITPVIVSTHSHPKVAAQCCKLW